MLKKLALTLFCFLNFGVGYADHDPGPPPPGFGGPPLPNFPPPDQGPSGQNGNLIIPQVLLDLNDNPETFIDLEKRSFDLERSFARLKSANRGATFYAIIDGQSVDDVVDVKALPGGTMLEVKIERGSHTETRVVKVEDFDEIGIRQSHRGRNNIRLPAGW